MKNKEKAKRIKIDYERHMQNMPEFNQPEVKCAGQIIVKFLTVEDMHKFSKMVMQPITAKTRSIYYPEVDETPYMTKRWSK